MPVSERTRWGLHVEDKGSRNFDISAFGEAQDVACADGTFWEAGVGK